MGLMFLLLCAFAISALHVCTNEACSWLSDSPQSWLDSLFFTIQMLVMNYGGIHGEEAPWQIQLARFGLPLLASISIIKGLIEVVAYRHLPLRIRFWCDHIVFCGCGDQARSLIREYLRQDQNKGIVVVDISDTPENKELENEGVLFLKEDARLPDALRQARVKQAHCVYLMAGSDQTNVEIFEKVIDVDNKRKTGDLPKNCFIHIYNNTLKSLVDIKLEESRKNGENRGWEIRTFNTWANSARALFTGEHGPHLYCPDTQQPHILILGHGWLAEQLIIQGARLGHYSGDRKLRITYIDEDAEHLRDRLFAQYPALDPNPAAHMAWHEKERGYLPVIDTCFIAKPAECMTGELYARVIKSTPLSAAYICHPDDEKALNILAALKANMSAPHGNQKPRLVLCGMHGNNLDYLIENTNEQGKIKSDQCAQVHYFDAVAAGVNIKKDENVIEGLREAWAKAIHAYYQEIYEGQAWEELSEDMRDSNRQSADHWKIKLDWIKSKNQRDMDAVLKTYRDVLMRLEHKRWCAERFMNGWRYCEKPSSKEDQVGAKARKLSWCLCPFDALSKEDKSKDLHMCDIAAKLHPLYGE